MKTLLKLGLTFAACTCTPLALAQNDSPGNSPGTPGSPAKPADPTRPDIDRDHKVAPKPVSEEDFVRTAVQTGAAEVKLAQLGVQKAEDEKVKDLAEKLVKDHTAANAELKTIADKMGIKTVTRADEKTNDRADENVNENVNENANENANGNANGNAGGNSQENAREKAREKAEQKYNELNARTGKEFDRAFVEHMSMCHEKSIAWYEAGRNVAKSEKVTAYIDKTLPVLRAHAAQIRGLHTGTRPDAGSTPGKINPGLSDPQPDTKR